MSRSKNVIPYAVSTSWISVTQFWLLLSGCQLQGASPYFSWHMSWWLSITNMACIRAPLTDSTRFVWIVCNEATGPQLETTGSGSKCHCHCGLSTLPPVLSRSCRLWIAVANWLFALSISEFEIFSSGYRAQKWIYNFVVATVMLYFRQSNVYPHYSYIFL